MRIIKFRIWDAETKSLMSPETNTNFVVDEKGNLRFFFLDGECEITQFTGLKDKNGKEIFEGDILKDINKVIWEVRYELNEFGIYATTSEFIKAVEMGEKYECFNWWEGCEVIGNKFENPELLDAKSGDSEGGENE